MTLRLLILRQSSRVLFVPSTIPATAIFHHHVSYILSNNCLGSIFESRQYLTQDLQHMRPHVRVSAKHPITWLASTQLNINKLLRNQSMCWLKWCSPLYCEREKDWGGDFDIKCTVIAALLWFTNDCLMNIWVSRWTSRYSHWRLVHVE